VQRLLQFWRLPARLAMLAYLGVAPPAKINMACKFAVFLDKGGKFRFRLKAWNGQIILTSQVTSPRTQR